MAFRRRRRGKPTAIGDAIVAYFKKRGLTDQARRLKLHQIWADAVGPDIASRAEPASFSRGTLTIRIESAAWRNELTFMKEEIISKLNALLGSRTVRELRVISGRPEPTGEPAAPPAYRTVERRDDERELAENTSEVIADEDIRRSFVELMEKSQRAKRGSGE